MRAANQLTSLLSTYTTEGMCYRVDLRLRPDGSQGEVCISLEAARQYYANRARDWELQMMIKARVAAGDRATGQRSARFRRAAHLFDHPGLFGDRRTLGHTRALERKIVSARSPPRNCRPRHHQRKTGARRHPRHRVSSAVLAAPLRRRRSLGASRRHDAGARATAG